MAKVIAFPLNLVRKAAIFRAAWDRCAEIQDMDKWELVLRPVRSKRTLDQNAKMWAMLHDIATQIQWVVDGRMQFLESEEWKDILTASLKQELRVAQGINGGIVLLGQRTRNMTIKQMSDLIELMNAFGAERGVRFKYSGDEVPDHYMRNVA